MRARLIRRKFVRPDGLETESAQVGASQAARQRRFPMITLKQIQVATDFSEPSDAALAYGRELAGQFHATLHVLHVAQNVYISTFGAENYVAMAPDLQQQ